MRRKFTNDSERKKARTIQNREAQQRRRANIKLKPKPLNPIKVVTPNVVTDYKNNLYEGCAAFPFSHSITLTNKNDVTLNMHDKSVERLIKWLSDERYITNYIKTNEYNGGNYHSHVVVQVNRWGFDLRVLLKKLWGNGFYRVVKITNDNHRLNTIRYCFKQIDVTSNRDLIQALNDTWSISLSQTVEALREAESFRLEDFKRTNNLYPYFRKNTSENSL